MPRTRYSAVAIFVGGVLGAVPSARAEPTLAVVDGAHARGLGTPAVAVDLGAVANDGPRSLGAPTRYRVEGGGACHVTRIVVEVGDRRGQPVVTRVDLARTRPSGAEAPVSRRGGGSSPRVVDVYALLDGPTAGGVEILVALAGETDWSRPNAGAFLSTHETLVAPAVAVGSRLPLEIALCAGDTQQGAVGGALEIVAR